MGLLTAAHTADSNCECCGPNAVKKSHHRHDSSICRAAIRVLAVFVHGMSIGFHVMCCDECSLSLKLRSGVSSPQQPLFHAERESAATASTI